MDSLWGFHSKESKKLVEMSGFENFKQTAARQYFQCTYSGFRSPFTLFLISALPKIVLLRIIFTRKKIENFSGSFWRKFIHKFHMAMLFEYALSQDQIGLLNISEPVLGNPTMFTYKGKKVSAELLISVIELNSFQKKTNALRDSITVLEIGAGYGRLAHLIQSHYKNVIYHIVDIPETLEISTRYLNTILPQSKFIFHNAYLGFPSGKFDVVFAIANLPEMTFEEREAYISNISSSCVGYFYNKQEWVRKNISNNIITEFVDYKVNGHLLSLYPADFTPQFFEAIYQFTNKELSN